LQVAEVLDITEAAVEAVIDRPFQVNLLVVVLVPKVP